MKRTAKFPIRLKILVGLLLIVTAVVSVITYTMANLFHKDKSTYINDLTSVMALHVAEETNSVLDGYGERLSTYLLILKDEVLTEDQKIQMIDDLISDFEEFVAITLHERDGGSKSTIYDAELLSAVGLTKEDLETYREENPLPIEEIRAGAFHIREAALIPDLDVFTVAIAEPNRDKTDTLLVSAMLRTDRLGRLAESTGPFTTMILDSEGNVLAPQSLGADESPEWVLSLASEGSEYGTGMAREYVIAETPMVGGFAPVGFGGVVAGVQIPKSAAFLASRELLRSLAIISLALLIGSVLVSVFLSRRLTRSIELLSDATKTVGQGDFDVHVKADSHDEIGALAASFNQMAGELKTRDEALAEAQGQLVQSEKMAAFGQLGAGIAHEVKNPLAGILGCAQLSLRMIEEGNPAEENLQMIAKETKRCKEIIENLLKFSRQEGAILTTTPLGPVIVDSVAIVRHQLELAKVKIEKDVSEDLPSIMANANQIQQVLMNLMMNAQQAMEGEPGNVKVSARKTDDGRVEIRVADDGPGISEENRKKVFEPFFTTKPKGKGTGLGLSVSFKIVNDHRGTIEIESAVGKGTTFVLAFPAGAGEVGAAEESAIWEGRREAV